MEQNRAALPRGGPCLLALTAPGVGSLRHLEGKGRCPTSCTGRHAHHPPCMMPLHPLLCSLASLQGALEHITVNNFPIGRNVDEALRTLQVRCGPAWPGRQMALLRGTYGRGGVAAKRACEPAQARLICTELLPMGCPSVLSPLPEHSLPCGGACTRSGSPHAAGRSLLAQASLHLAARASPAGSPVRGGARRGVPGWLEAGGEDHGGRPREEPRVL